jgi:hypothetical protein
MTQCLRHAKIETNLSCGKCGDPICPKCLVQTPVGARCPKCAGVSRVPTYRVSGIYYLRAVGAGLLLAVVSGFLWGLLRAVPYISFFNFIIAAAAGYGIGEGISLAVNRKAGNGLAVIGGAALVLSYIISRFIFGFGFISLFDIIAVIIGIFVTVTRLR